MAAPDASTSGQDSLPAEQTKLSLTNVGVTFLAERPETKIRLTIKVGGDKREVVIHKGEPVQWAGTIRSLAHAKLAIHMHRRNRAGLWVKFASVGVVLAENASPIIDNKQKISVVVAIHESGAYDPQISTVLAEVAAAKQVVEKRIPIVEKLKPILRVLEVLTKIGMPLKDINPAIGYTVEAVKALIELFKLQETCREEALSLVDELTSFLSVEKHIELVQKRIETRRAVNTMLDIITESANFIREKTAVGLRGVIDDLLGSKYREKIDKLKKEFIRAKDSFDRSVELEILVAVDGIELTTQFAFLHQKLSECDDAYFRSDHGCLDGTRTGLLRHVMEWIEDVDEAQPNIFWLRGSAGSGKTTVANTVAKMIAERGHQLSCFFCKRDDPNLSSPVRLLPTLAYRFAEQHPSYRAAVMRLLRTSRGAGLASTADIRTQFERLFEELLVQTVDPLRPHVVVIDAPDECGSFEDQNILMKQLLALSRTVPWIKVFVTSRGEFEIFNALSQATDCISYNIDKETGVDNDIRLYITSQAESLQLSLCDEDVQKLVKQAEGLFIWCRTLFEYLRGGLDASTLLSEFLSGEGDGGSSEPWSELYALYDKILNSALGRRQEDASFVRTILSIVNVAVPHHALSTKAIVSFLHGQKQYAQFTVDAAEKAVKKLHAVLYVNAAANGGVRAHHTSFYDFLAWKTSTSTDPGWKTSSEANRFMAVGCIRTLRTDLKFNICKIDTPVLNKAIADLAARIATHVSEALQYSCQFWFIHLSLSSLTSAEVEKDVSALLCTKMLLFWFESLSLMGFLRQIQFLFRQCIRTFFQTCPTIVAAAEDACRIVSSFADAMDSVPHIYLSALLWVPEDSAIYKNLGLFERTSWHLIENKRTNWDPLVWGSDQIEARSIAFSPDGRFVAYGTSTGDVYIRDSQTGALEGEPFQGHQKAVRSLAYSPDGRLIASGSEDYTVRIWDARIGESVFAPIEGHSEYVRCVAFSPDGLFIASGSWDHTVQIWNAQTGELEGEPLWHPGDVNALAFSPDGRFIASGCDDRCVHVWDLSSRQEALEPLQGRRWVLCVAYSPDGHTIVSGLRDNSICIWDAHTGKAIGQPLQGHAAAVTSVAYSPDGRFIISGSFNGTVRLWDAASRAPIGSPLQALSSYVQSVSYSPDGSLIASAASEGVRVWDASTCFAAGGQSFPRPGTGNAPAVNAVAYSPDGLFIASGSDDNQIRIWHAQTGAAVYHPVLKHPGLKQGGKIQSMAYSPDGHFIVSGSGDGINSTVCVLDVQTGATISGPFQGHSDNIWSVAYSPDGCFIASASGDKTVHLWDVQANAASGKPLQVRSPVRSIAFSPDGHLLACGTADGRIWLWDANTRVAIREPIQAHSKWIYSLAFSPDGHYIASGSDDCFVKIWDAHTGKASGSSPQRHQRAVRCVAYSPDGCFIASSSNNEVIIWDAPSGSACRELRGPSTLIWSVAYSPDGRFLVSGAENGNIYVHEVSPEHDDTEARWMTACSEIDMHDGWITDGGILLLWVPVSYRENVRFCARRIMADRAQNFGTYSIDYRTLLTRYSGRKWTDIFPDFDD